MIRELRLRIWRWRNREAIAHFLASGFVISPRLYHQLTGKRIQTNIEPLPSIFDLPQGPPVKGIFTTPWADTTTSDPIADIRAFQKKLLDDQ